MIEALKKRPYSYLEMQMLGISTSPQKRVMESLAEGEVLLKSRVNGLVRWRVKQVSLGRSK